MQTQCRLLSITQFTTNDCEFNVRLFVLSVIVIFFVST